jgi:hypothetical protein
MTEEGCRSLGQRAAAVFDFQHGRAGLINQQMIEGVGGVGDDAQRAGGEAFST